MTPEKVKKHIQRRGYFTRKEIPEELRAIEPEVLLGRSVLDQALLDLIEYPAYEIKWFDKENEDFKRICYIACFEPEMIEAQVHSLFKQLFPTVEITTYVSSEYRNFFLASYKVLEDV